MALIGRAKLQGVVEVDEVFAGSEWLGKRGFGADGESLIIGAVDEKERKTGKVRLAKIADASSGNLDNFIDRNIKHILNNYYRWMA